MLLRRGNDGKIREAHPLRYRDLSLVASPNQKAFFAIDGIAGIA